VGGEILGANEQNGSGSFLKYRGVPAELLGNGLYAAGGKEKKSAGKLLKTTGPGVPPENTKRKLALGLLTYLPCTQPESFWETAKSRSTVGDFGAGKRPSLCGNAKTPVKNVAIDPLKIFVNRGGIKYYPGWSSDRRRGI